MDAIGTWARDWSTHMGTVNSIGGYTMAQCGACQTKGGGPTTNQIAFLPSQRSRTVGKPNRRGEYADSEFKCVPGHANVLYDPENPDSDHAFEGHTPGCKEHHPMTISVAPPHGRGNSRDNATGGQFTGPNQDDEHDDRTIEITPSAHYELEPIPGAPKANLGDPMAAFGTQKNLERQVGFTGEEIGRAHV